MSAIFRAKYLGGKNVSEIEKSLGNLEIDNKISVCYYRNLFTICPPNPKRFLTLTGKMYYYDEDNGLLRIDIENENKEQFIRIQFESLILED